LLLQQIYSIQLHCYYNKFIMRNYLGLIILVVTKLIVTKSILLHCYYVVITTNLFHSITLLLRQIYYEKLSWINNFSCNKVNCNKEHMLLHCYYVVITTNLFHSITLLLRQIYYEKLS